MERWNDDEISKLVSLREEGCNYKEISKILGRSMSACRSKIHSMTPKRKEYNKKYNKYNKEKRKEYDKKRYQENKEKYRRIYQDNKEKIQEYSRKYSRKYRAEHPECGMRKERYKGEFTHINEKFQNDGAFCQITNCDEKVYDLEMHHIIPVKDNKEFWESCSIEEVLDNTILLCKPLHKNLHSYCGYKNYSEDKFYKWLDQLSSEKIDKILSDWDLCDGQVNLDTF